MVHMRRRHGLAWMGQGLAAAQPPDVQNVVARPAETLMRMSPLPQRRKNSSTVQTWTPRSSVRGPGLGFGGAGGFNSL